ncbi:MAG: Cys-tRNA(Pro) deacylase [Deferrisomatales bacterium]
MATTPALRFLKECGIAYEARAYAHKVKGASYAAEALGWPVEAMAKTLVAGLSDGSFVQCLLPGHLELSLKALARQAGVKGARMATADEAEKLTGYRVGGISPFGVRKSVGVWIHRSLMERETIGVNGGRRGLIVFVDPRDVQRVLGAQVADLAA